MNPHISIIVPAYNEEKSIKKCLESLTGQLYPQDQFEIILVDNNCQDNTITIARQHSAKVKIVKETQQGLTHARIKGIRNSSSPIIAFLDADSLVGPNWLTSIEKTFNKNPKLVGIGFAGDLQPKNLTVKILETLLHLSYRVSPVMPGYCFAFKRAAYHTSGGLDPRIKFGEDIFLSKKLKKVGKIIIKKGHVVTSSRRYLSFSSFLSYIFKTLISFVSITLFDKSFVELTPFSTKTRR